MSRTTPPYEYSPITERAYDLPDDTRVAVWVIINVEHFLLDEPYEPGDPVPDTQSFGRREYGLRAGYWRLLDVLDEFGVPATLTLNSSVCDHEPQVVQAAVDRDWAIMGHGVTNSERLVHMEPAEERAAIEETRDRIAAFAGQAPEGWLSPGLMQSFETMELLAEAGFTYVSDWCADDVPFEFTVGDLVSVPYSLDLNDKGLISRQGASGPEYRDAIIDAYETLRHEADEPGNARVLPIPLHPFIVGQPFRAPYFREALEYVASDDDAWVTTGDEIAAHFRENYC